MILRLLKRRSFYTTNNLKRNQPPPFFCLLQKEGKNHILLRGKNLTLAPQKYFSSSYKDCVLRSGYLHGTINFQKPVYLHLELFFSLYCRDLQRELEMGLKRSSFSNCAYWSEFRKNIFSSTTKFFRKKQPFEFGEKNKWPNCLYIFSPYLNEPKDEFCFAFKRLLFYNYFSSSKPTTFKCMKKTE